MSEGIIKSGRKQSFTVLYKSAIEDKRLPLDARGLLAIKLLTDSELKKGLEIRINMMAELRGDAASRANWYRTMRDTGVLSVNEIRALEDLPFIDGGDTHYASLNYVPLSEFVELSRQRAAGKETPPQ